MNPVKAQRPYAPDEVGDVGARLGAVTVGDVQPQAVVLDVGTDRWVRFDEATEFRFPVAVADCPVDVAAARVGCSQRVCFKVLKLT